MKIISLILILQRLFLACADSHTLAYYSTAFSAPVCGLPEFSINGYVDDEQIMLYRSDVGRDDPVAPWMKKEGQKYWDKETEVSKQMEIILKEMVNLSMSRFNQTGGIHYGQWISKCELSDDGSTSGDTYIRYDGREFIFLDMKWGIWTANMFEAELTTQKWNQPEINWGEKQKTYLHNECVYRLKKFIGYGKEDLEKRVRPDVKVMDRPKSDGVTRLQCLVYGFHPRPVDVKWVRNGVDQVPSDERTPILPHPDGTYQITVSVEVPTEEGDSYSCHVDHSSLEEPLVVKWDPKNGSPISVICVAVIFSFFGVCGVIGLCFYFFKNRKKRLASESPGPDANFDASSYQSAPVSESP